MSPQIKIIIVDDHPVALAGLRDILRNADEIDIIAEAESGEQLVDLLKNGNVPDIVLLDINLPDTNGVQLMQKIKKLYKKLKVILFSLTADNKYIAKCMNEGANAYIKKESSRAEYRFAIAEVHYRNQFFSPDIAKLGAKLKTEEQEAERKPLSKKEKELLRLICEGFLNKEIAAKLDKCIQTIDYHKKNLMVKTGCKNDAQLGVYARNIGLIA